MGGQMLSLRVPDSRKAVRILRTVPGVRRAAIFGDTIHVTLSNRDRDWPQAQAALAGEHQEVTEMREVEPSLEDVFIDRVSGREDEAA
jgi:ABC-2 type transport system ATP-binding protein